MNALRTTVAALALALFTAGSALAGPPLETDDAGTVDVGKVEIELNGSTMFNKEKTSGVTEKTTASDGSVKITTGLYKALGISLEVPYTFSDRTREDGQLVGKADGFGDMTLEVKYAFAELAGINFAIKPTLIMPTGKYSAGLSEGRWQPGVVLIATKEFEDGTYALHANIGYEHHAYRLDEAREALRSNIWSASVAGEVEVMKGLFAVADFGLKSSENKEGYGSTELPIYALTGARYEINDFLDVNAGVKVGLTKAEDDVTVLYGVVLKF
ncbi:transporter [Trichlorobacter ammonificans]|uniref:Transporter n=1 Tax=Trichlorobacter ammonificans TaxID=2916410 RepID=A0ABM9D6N1_9BACT|nr:transporter [Trichlorobacter ammonificans]CAH2030643.1 conserved exported protein of unknown function [Trichlorobacter ammonificans]